MRIDMKMEKMSQKALERKSNKPIMEKKRRARINHCLNQLKALILEADNERSRHSKLEKADILEMTVKYLQTFRAYHLAQVQQLNQLQSAGHQQQVQLHKQLQQQQAAIVQRQQALAAGSAQSSPSPPMNLTSQQQQPQFHHHQLPLPLQLSLQAAMASVVTTDMLNAQASAGELSPAGSNASSNNSSSTTASSQNLFQHHTGLNHHQHHHQHHHNHLQALNTNHTSAHQQHPSQMSPTWRPW